MNIKSYFLLILCGTITPLLCMEEPATKKQRIESKQDSLNDPLWKATAEGNCDKVQQLLEQGADANARIKKANTEYRVIHYAAAKGYTKIVKLLLNYNAYSNCNGKVGAKFKGVLSKLNGTPLHYAVARGDKKLVQILLKAGADINYKANVGTTTDVTALYLAVQENMPEMVEFLLNNGADSSLGAGKRDSHKGITPLHLASEQANLPIAELLVKEGANVNASTPGHSRKPLDFAIEQKHLEIAQFLAEHGAHMLASNERGWPLKGDTLILKNAVLKGILKNGWAELAKKLLLTGTFFPEDLDQKEIITFNEALNDQPLTLAVIHNDLEQVKSLIKQGATPVEKEIALLYAIAQLRKDSALYLLGSEIDPQHGLKLIKSIIKNKKSERRWFDEERGLSKSLKSQLIRRLPLAHQILSRPALVDAISYSRGTQTIPIELDLKIYPTGVLLDAIARGDVTYVSRALKAGADPNAKNLQGTPALALAAFADDIEKAEKMVEVLLTHKATVSAILLHLLCTCQDALQRQNIIKKMLCKRVSLAPETYALCKTLLKSQNN
jgi:uncharacterized protein